MNTVSRLLLCITVSACPMLAQELVSAAGRLHRPAHPSYAALSNHREIVLKAFDLAVTGGFLDTAGIDQQAIRDRLEAGAYGEDYEAIPGVLGAHFPNPWDQGPDFDFNGLYPFSKIPYGSLDDSLSGWFRGFPHGYDPVQGFTWPGTGGTTVDWAGDSRNTFSWNHAVALYREGKKAEAYECIGHLLHLLADLSMPEHVKVIDHGVALSARNGGTLFSPDLATLVVDEYEQALAGGLELPNVIKVIPDLLGVFRTALAAARPEGIPRFLPWHELFVRLATYTYNDSVVRRYFGAPQRAGAWGVFKNAMGEAVVPMQYGITLPARIGDRWTQLVLKSTATVGAGTVIPEPAMVAMCNTLVPAAAEHSAGLLLAFLDSVKSVTAVPSTRRGPLSFTLEQNYPNPCNPTTTIRYSIAQRSHVSLKIYSALGQAVETLVDCAESAGERMAVFDASGLASGVYLYRLQAGSFTETKMLVVVK